MNIIRIQCNCAMDEFAEDINFRNIKKKLREQSLNKGTSKIQHLYTWNYEGTDIICYGWVDGLPGKENKHDLPPNGNKAEPTLDNSDTQLLFGDLFILQKKDTVLCDFDVSDYGLFYSLCFEGFDDCLTDDNEDGSDESDESDDYNDDYNDDSGKDDEDVEGDEDDEDDEGDTGPGLSNCIVDSSSEEDAEYVSEELEEDDTEY